jgi:hypothetical protein
MRSQETRIIIATVVAITATIILSSSLFATKTFAADDSNSNNKKSKSTDDSENKKSDTSDSDKKASDTGSNDNDNDRPHFPPPGLPVVTGNDNDNYNDNGITKKFDTSNSPFSMVGGKGRQIIQYMPGFNETFYNSTLPYCYAVKTGACYDNMNNRIIP